MKLTERNSGMTTRPDSLIDFGAIQVLYLLTYLLTKFTVSVIYVISDSVLGHIWWVTEDRLACKEILSTNNPQRWIRHNLE